MLPDVPGTLQSSAKPSNNATLSLHDGDNATHELPLQWPVAAAAVMTDDELDGLLRALGDATRRRLLDRLREQPGLTLGALAEGFEQSRQAISKHLALLAAADLVVCIWRGREKLHYLNPVPLQALPARWVTTSAREHSAALHALQRALRDDAP